AEQLPGAGFDLHGAVVEESTAHPGGGAAGHGEGALVVEGAVAFQGIGCLLGEGGTGLVHEGAALAEVDGVVPTPGGATRVDEGSSVEPLLAVRAGASEGEASRGP